MPDTVYVPLLVVVVSVPAPTPGAVRTDAQIPASGWPLRSVTVPVIVPVVPPEPPLGPAERVRSLELVDDAVVDTELVRPVIELLMAAEPGELLRAWLAS
jgi:hypothetical protein